MVRKLNEDAKNVLAYVVKNVSPELRTQFDPSVLFNILSGIDNIMVIFAELEKEGYINSNRVPGGEFLYFTLELKSFVELDNLIYGWYTEADAVAIVNLQVSEKIYSVQELESLLKRDKDWNRRRMNAAILYLKQRIYSPGYVSEELTPDYPTLYLKPNVEEIVLISQLKEDLVRRGIEIPTIQITALPA